MNEQVLTTNQTLDLPEDANGKIVNDGPTAGSCQITSGSLIGTETVPANSNLSFRILPPGGTITNTGTPPLTIFWTISVP